METNVNITAVAYRVCLRWLYIDDVCLVADRNKNIANMTILKEIKYMNNEEMVRVEQLICNGKNQQEEYNDEGWSEYNNWTSFT